MRARELINFNGTPGKYNSITDVDDVEVGVPLKFINSRALIFLPLD